MENSTNNKVIVSSMIFGPNNAFSLIKDIEYIEIEECENFQKKSYRNRYYLQSATGVQIMTVPIELGRNHKSQIKDTKICHAENWVNKHLQAIRTNYGSAAYYEHYFPQIESLLIKKQHFLLDLNNDSLLWSMNSLFWNKNIGFTKHYDKNYAKNIADHRNNQFNKSNKSIQYPQVFELDSVQNGMLSIIDLLMNTGPEANTYL